MRKFRNIVLNNLIYLKMSYFDLLAPETIIEIALKLSLSSISTYCQLSEKFNNTICNNDYF